ERGRQLGTPVGDLRRLLHYVRVDGRRLVRLRERDLSGQALDQPPGECVDVALAGRRIALDLLRGDVVDRADELAGAGQAGVVRRLDQAEVGQIGVIALADQD